MAPFDWNNLYYFGPELVLTGAILIVVVLDLLIKGKRKDVMLTVAMAGLVAAAAVTAKVTDDKAHILFSGMVVLDPFAVFFKYLFLAATFIILLFCWRSHETGEAGSGEFTALTLTVTLGSTLMAAASDLLMVYLSVEIVSVMGYILSGFRRDNRKSSEAALKYIIYGGAASGVMLYGISLLYGMTGQTGLFAIRDVIVQKGAVQPFTMLVAVTLIFAGIGYKIASVPFHMWCPDVYEGAPTPVTAFLSVAPKAAGFAVLIRFFYILFVDPQSWGGELTAIGDVPWPALLGVVAVLTMTLGNVSAIWQTNMKRFLAYSSIAHAGYILMGATAVSKAGLEAMLLYLVIYLFMNLGAFLVVITVSTTLGSEEITDYRGLGYRAPFLAVAMAIFLFSLTGIPPFAGFIGKLYLFVALIQKAETWYTILALIGILNSVISLYYYARVVRAMFLEKPAVVTPLEEPILFRYTLAALAIPVIVLGLYWPPLLNVTGSSLRYVAGL